MTISRLLPVALFAAVAAALLPASRAGAQDTSGGKFVVANTIRIFNEMEETKALTVALQAQGRNLKVEDDRRRTELENIKSTRDRFKPETPDFNTENQKLLKGTIEYQTWGRLTQAELQRQQKQQMKILFDKIEVAASEVGKQMGVDVIFAEQKLEFPQLDNPEVSDQAVRAIISQRNMLYLNARIDITQQIIASLDAKYKASGGAPAPAPAPAPAGGAAPPPAPAPAR